MSRDGARRRPGRPARAAGTVTQQPWSLVEMPYRPVEVLGADQVGAIHEAALTVLEEIGMRVLEPRARDLYRRAGADVDEGDLRVRFDRAMIAELVARAPAEFTLAARNPERDLKVGGRHVVFASVGGPAYVMDNDKGRRTGTYAEMCDYIRLVHALNIVHQEGGGPFEPLDLPAATRHLDL
jgi:trimethylamine--corrinoid protein Co-methyltransferase